MILPVSKKPPERTAESVKVEAGATPDTLVALGGAPEPTRYSLTWNDAAFRYDIAEKTAPPTPTPTTSTSG